MSPSLNPLDFLEFVHSSHYFDYLHTPGFRAEAAFAMSFVVSLATMVCKTIDHVLRTTKPSGERRRTVKSLDDIHANTIVKYDRCHDRLSIMGGPGATGDVFSIVDRLEIDPQLLLGYRDLRFG